jgi:hypothetical protein
LLAWGAAALARALPGWWRLLAVPVALALLEFVLLPLTLAVHATNRPPGPLGAATPASYGFAYQDVAFRTADGVRLSAWYLPAHNGAAVVLLPGAGATRAWPPRRGRGRAWRVLGLEPNLKRYPGGLPLDLPTGDTKGPARRSPSR